MTDTGTPPEDERADQESSEHEGKQSEEQDSEERRQAADSDERTVTESGGYGSPDPGERRIALDEAALDAACRSPIPSRARTASERGRTPPSYVHGIWQLRQPVSAG